MGFCERRGWGSGFGRVGDFSERTHGGLGGGGGGRKGIPLKRCRFSLVFLIFFKKIKQGYFCNSPYPKRRRFGFFIHFHSGN
jgi:hypothetical protein